MGKNWLIFGFLIFYMHGNAQVEKDTIDLNYLEDQLYVSLTYNILINKPTTIEQNGFSGGFSIGFIKDIPFNRQRNFGIGVGLGYAYNSYIQNLKITQENETSLFETAQDYTINRFGMSALEVPIELRWRNSTPQKYKFLRVYTGFKVAYVLSAKTKFKDNNITLATKNISEINRLQYGLTLAAGFSTWNLYMYYGLNPFFNDVEFIGKSLDLTDFNIGLKFYIM